MAKVLTVLSVYVGVSMAVIAEAQMGERTGRAFISVNGGYQTGDRNFEARVSFPLYDEVADFTVRHSFGAGGLFDVSGGVHVWRGLGVALGFTWFEAGGAIDVTGTVPHPLVFDRPRNLSFQRADFEHRQIAVHFQAVYVVPATDRFELSIFGGPSVFRLQQGLVTLIDTAEVGDPFGTVNVRRVTTQSVTETGLGGNAGADVTYLLTEQLGVGVFVRFAGGSVELPTTGGTLAVDVGGLQIGGGLRLRF
jgi:hypothetical protein